MACAFFYSRPAAGRDNRRGLLPERATDIVASLSSRNRVRRYTHLFSTASLAALALGSGPARANDECGVLGAGGVPNSATCTQAGNPYPDGINYSANITPIFVTLEDGVSVVIQPGSATVNAVNLDNSGGGPISGVGADATLTVDGAFIDNSAITAPNKSGLRIQTNGNATIRATNTAVNVVGAQSTNAIWAIVLPSSDPNTAATVIYDGPGVTSIGTTFSTVIQAQNDGTGASIIDAAGNITGVALGSAANGVTGLFAAGNTGTNKLASVLYRRGTIDVRGTFANGIFASGGTATVTTAPKTNIIVTGTGGPLKPGIAVDSDGTLTVDTASTIQVLGSAVADPGFRNNGFGIRASSFGAGPINVTLRPAGSITTEVPNGIGIAALAAAGGPITITASGPIATLGAASHGISATTTTGPIQISATNVSATGQFSTGISATGGTGAVTVNVASGGSVMGGWQPNVTGVNPNPIVGLPALPATGVFLNSTGGTKTLNNFGSIGALSDRAIAGDPVIINNGVITGFVQFTGSNNSIVNNGTFNLRHFADTNGDGVRDTLRVAIADLGEGANNSFTNNGTLALPAVTGATTLDSTGQYLPLGNPNNTMALGGPLQGHLIGVGASTFTNSGTIDLQTNPVAGDVLVITGARQAGTAGPGTFTANGGRLKLDTVLNEGGAATRSDTLVVDGTSVGGGGATPLAIRNAGGAGALTVGDGILVIEVLDPARSAPGAFVGGAVAGPYEYLLVRGGFTPGSEGDWFLRNTLDPPAPPGTPRFRREVSLYAAMPVMAALYGREIIDTLHERMGGDAQLLRPGKDDMPDGMWGRIIGTWGHRDGDTVGIFGRDGPEFDYSFGAFQAGLDLYRREYENGQRDNAGLYVAFGRAHADVEHNLLGFTFDGGDDDFDAVRVCVTARRTASALPPRWKAVIHSTWATTGCSNRRHSWFTRPSTSTISTTVLPMSATPIPTRSLGGLACG
jgi:Autochaperone Domain Type 1